MKYLYDISGAQSNVAKVNVRHGGTTLLAGAAIMQGVTSGTNNVAGIVASGALADVIGVLEATVLSSVTDFSMSTPVTLRQKALVGPLSVFLAEYDQASLVTATSASSGTTINVTSIEDIAGGWIYVVGGTGKGQLLYVVSAAANTLTVKTAPAVALDTTSTLIKVEPTYRELISLNATADKLASQAAAGTGKARVLANYFRANGYPLQELTPEVHNGLTGLDALSAHFYSAIIFLDHAFNISA